MSISDLTASKYSMRTSQLTKIQNGSRLEKKAVRKSFLDFQVYSNDSQPVNKLFDVLQMQIGIASFSQIKNSAV
jgi:hypothetical protein